MTSTKTLMRLKRPAGSADWASSDRRETLRSDGVPDVPVGFEGIRQLAASIFDGATATIAFIDDERRAIEAVAGGNDHRTAANDPFCAHVLMQDDVMVVPDARKDPCFAVSPLVIGKPHIRFYAAMPIRAFDGTPVAVLSVSDPKPRPHGVTDMQRTALKVLAAQVEEQLELRRALSRRIAKVETHRGSSSDQGHVAERDALTGLPTRTAFQQRLQAVAGIGGARRRRAAVMLIDVDHFKQVNDAFGHDAGDALLREFGVRLRGSFRATDMVARIGGDEFAAILTGVSTDDALGTICRSLRERLREPLVHRGRRIDCRASIGIAVYPDHAGTPDALVKCADLALNAAKACRGSVVLFEEQMGERFDRDLALLGQARAALAADRIAPAYQPKIDLRTGAVVGLEALARLRSGRRLVEHRDLFSTALSNSDTAAAIGERLIGQVLDDVRSWVDASFTFGRVAINGCAADFAPNDFAERLLAALAARRLDPRLIELEVTEGVFVGRGAHHVARALNLLSQGGVRIAFDDFGTGHASLSHLKEFPIDALKIDPVFVKGVTTNADDAAIVRALVGLGRSLGIDTVALGIETAEQAAILGAWGCCTGQGELYGPPSSSVDARAFMKAAAGAVAA